MSSVPSANRRPYRSHKTPACDRCRRFKRRCTGGGPGDPCVLCKLQNVPCLPSDIARAHSELSRSNQTHTSRRQRQIQGIPGNNNPIGPNLAQHSEKQALCGLESNEHDATHLGISRGESSIVISPVLSEDVQALERYFSSDPPAGEHFIGPDSLDKSLVYMNVPRHREGLAIAKHPAKLQKEILWQIIRPYAAELVRLYFLEFHPAFPILDEVTFLEIYEQDDKISPALLCEFFALSLTLWDHSDFLRQHHKPDLQFIWNLAVEGLQQDFLAPGLSTIYSVLFDMTGRPIYSVLGNTINDGRAVALARSLGLNRDPTNWKRPYSEKNLRVRLWWAILIHDYWSSFAHGVAPNITNRQYDVPIPTLIDLTHRKQSQNMLKASECFIHLCSLTVILGEVLPLVYDLEQRDIWRDIRRLEANLDTWEEEVTLPLKGRSKKYHGTVSGLSSLCLSYLSIRLLLCRIAFRAANKSCSADIDRTATLQFYLGRLRRSAQDIVEYVCSLEREQLREFWLVYTAHHLTFTCIILLRCTIESSDDVITESCKSSLIKFWAKLQDIAKNEGWDLAVMCISRCGESLAKVMCSLNKVRNDPVLSNQENPSGGSVSEGFNQQNSAIGDANNLMLSESSPDGIIFSNLDLWFEDSADTFWSGLDFTPFSEETDTGHVYL